MTASIASPSARSAQWMRTRMLVETADALGCPRQRALAGTRITQDMLSEPGHTLTVPDQIRIMINCARALPDAPLGLQWGQALDAFSRDRLGVWMSAHRDLGRLLDSAIRYQGVLSSPVTGKGIRSGDSYRFELHYPRGTDLQSSLIRLNNESMMTSFLMTFRQLVQKHFVPRALYVTHQRPGYGDEYQGVFGCPVHFEADVTALVLEESHLALPIISHNPANEALYSALVDKEHRQHVQSRPVSEQVQAHLNQRLDQSQTLAPVARSLGFSERTLRRKLEQEGTTFRELHQRALTAQARELMSRPDMTVEAAAQKLGYADPSNFRRALKRIAGLSPSQLRNEYTGNGTSTQPKP